MTQDIIIPTPIAPARPIQSPSGMTTPATFPDGSTGVIDAQGNIIKNGAVIQQGEGNIFAPLFEDLKQTGSEMAADAGTAGKSATQIAQRTVFGISLYDAVAITLGIVLIIGALYSFQGTKDVITKATKIAAKTAAEAA